MLALALRQWGDRRSARIGWAVGWFLLVTMYVATWPTVRAHAKQYDAILADMPDALRAAMGASGEGSLGTPGGYLTAELLAVVGPLVAVTMGVLLGVGVLARDEEDGTLEILLAQSVSRAKLIWARTLAAAVEVVLVLMLAGAVLWAVGLLVGLGLDLVTCLRAMGMLALLALEGLMASVFAGALTGRTGRARAIAGCACLMAFLVAALGPTIDAVRPLVRFSPFRTLVASDPFRAGVDVVAVLAMLAPSCLLLLAALAVFRTRDLRLR